MGGQFYAACGGRLIRFGFLSGDEALVGHSGVPLITGLAARSDNRLFATFSANSDNQAEGIGEISTATAQISNAQISFIPSLQNQFHNIRGMTFDSTDACHAIQWFTSSAQYLGIINPADGSWSPFLPGWGSPGWFYATLQFEAIVHQFETGNLYVIREANGFSRIYQVFETEYNNFSYQGEANFGQVNYLIRGLTYGPTRFLTPAINLVLNG